MYPSPLQLTRIILGVQSLYSLLDAWSHFSQREGKFAMPHELKAPKFLVIFTTFTRVILFLRCTVTRIHDCANEVNCHIESIKAKYMNKKRMYVKLKAISNLFSWSFKDPVLIIYAYYCFVMKKGQEQRRNEHYTGMQRGQTQLITYYRFW